MKWGLSGPKGLFSMMEETATQTLDWDQCWDFHPPDSDPIGVEDLVLVLKECENSRTLITTTTGSKNSQKEANNQTDNQNQWSVPPQRSLLYWLLVLDEVKCKTHTQQQTRKLCNAHFSSSETSCCLKQ